MSNRSGALAEQPPGFDRGKRLFTPGPPPVLPPGLSAIDGAFGRGDDDYDLQRAAVLAWLRNITGKRKVVELQGSGSLAIEVMIRNFIFGKVLVVNTGHYSDRILQICESLKRGANVGTVAIETVDYEDLQSVGGEFDWVIGVYVETSLAIKQDLSVLRMIADRCGAKLAIDAVASIGLEANHELADVMAFSSCKGLFGITGAGFVAFDSEPGVEVSSFYLNLKSHQERSMTGPYAQIQYLFGIHTKHSSYASSVSTNKSEALKRFGSHLANPAHREPRLCTRLTVPVKALEPKVILYSPRSKVNGSIINHLGELSLGERAGGKILNVIELQTL